MIRKVQSNKIHTEKITNEPFDDIIGHSNGERKYFTVENNDIIYKRLKAETNLIHLPYLGPCVDFGVGDVCIEESVLDDKEVFKFYVIDRADKDYYQEFDNIKDAIQRLVDFYTEVKDTSDPEKVKAIFMETLNLTENQELSLTKKSN